MNIVDLILALGLFWFARKGWQIGLVQSLIMLFSVILAYCCALAYGETTARALFDTTEDLGKGAALFGFIVVFAAVLVACYFIGSALHKALRASPVGAIGRIWRHCSGVGARRIDLGADHHIFTCKSHSQPRARIHRQFRPGRAASKIRSG